VDRESRIGAEVTPVAAVDPFRSSLKEIAAVAPRQHVPRGNVKHVAQRKSDSRRPGPGSGTRQDHAVMSRAD